MNFKELKKISNQILKEFFHLEGMGEERMSPLLYQTLIKAHKHKTHNYNVKLKRTNILTSYNILQDELAQKFPFVGHIIYQKYTSYFKRFQKNLQKLGKKI